MIQNFLKTGWRHVRRQSFSGIINIAGFAIAIASVLIIALWVQNELRFDNYHPNSDRIYLLKNRYVYDNGDQQGTPFSPHAVVNHLQNNFQEIENIAYSYSPRELSIKHNNEMSNEAENATFISEGWFNTFSYEFFQGNYHSFFDRPHSVILTESQANRLFGTSNVVGKTLTVNAVDHEIKGVVRDSPSNSSFKSDFFFPFEDPTELGSSNDWTNFTTTVFIQLKKDFDPLTTRNSLQDLMEKNIQWPQRGINIGVELQPVEKLHFDKDLSPARYRIGSEEAVTVFSILAFLLLIVSSINYMNISLGQLLRRMKEIGVRKVLGAEKKHIVLQFLIEILLKSSISFLLALLLSVLVLPEFNSIFHTELRLFPLEKHLAPLLALIWSLIFILTSVLPSLYLASFKPVNLFSGVGSFQVGGKRVRQTLLGGQFVISIGMIITSITMYNQLEFIQSRYHTDSVSSVFKVDMPALDYPEHLQVPPSDGLDLWFAARERFEEEINRSLKAELLNAASISRVSTSAQPSVVDEQYQMVGALDWDGKAPDYQPRYADWTVDEDFMQVMRLKMLAGTWFNNAESADLNNMILNESAVREFQLQEPVIGRRFRSNNREGIIIGVVKDFHFQSLREKIRPMVLHKKPNWGNQFLIEAKGISSSQAVNHAKQVVKSRFPEKMFSYQFLDDEIEQMYRGEKNTMVLASILASIAVLLSFLGLIGMVVLLVEHKKKEIGVRKVMGASAFNIITHLSKEFVRLVLVSIAVASPIAWWTMTNWLNDFAYRIELRWWIFGLSGAVALVMAIVIVSSQAFKAASVNPVDSLRDE